MCFSQPKVETPSSPPTMKSVEPDANKAASRAAEIRRRQQALSRADAHEGGAMQGTPQGPGVNKKLGQEGDFRI
ncbi:MAG: hypothetical protein LBO68_04085 [Synergistaceae bacterium]|jgi:hypothetical protein|nr:hypothetical protein [Synergistaceae bacterium]